MKKVLPFLNKDQEMPDSYVIRVYFYDGSMEDFETASHGIQNGFLEIVTKTDLWRVIPMEAVKKIEFDKNFSKALSIRNKQKIEADKQIQEATAKKDGGETT